MLDSGALIALERGDARMRELVRLARLHDRRTIIPAPVIAQVWRDGSRQNALARLLRASFVQTASLDEPLARIVGALCGRAGTDDVVDATVVIVTRRENAVVVSSDPDDLRRLDPSVAIQPI